MNLATLPVFIVLVVQIIHLRTDCQERCSCYTFENGTNAFGSTWLHANASCENYKKHLVVIETEREWEFINKAIQTRKALQRDEWHIGLYRNTKTGKWIWINGKPLSIEKWQIHEPEDTDSYALIAKEYPKGHHGSFSSIEVNVYRAWICEEETDNCQGVCFIHNSVPTNSTPVETSTATPAATTHQIETVKTSTSYDHTNGSVSDSITTTSVPSLDGQKGDEDNSTTLVIITASLAAVFFVVLIVLAVVLLLRRKKRRGHRKDTEIPKKKSSDKNAQLGENHYETVDPVEAAKLLGTQDSSKTRPAAKKKDEHEPPSANCEYAMVNKKDKKKKEGDLVYAQLAEFDGDNKDTQKPPQKPPSYEPTVYADVDIVPPDVFSRTDPDSTQPTYANVQTTGV